MFNLEKYYSLIPNIIFAATIALIITPFLRRFGLKHGFSTKGKGLADPNDRGIETRTHEGIMSRLGEFAVVIPLLLLVWKDLNLNTQLLGIVLSLSMIAVIGAFDAKYDLSEFVKLSILFFASILLIFTGTVIDVNSIINLHHLDILINNPITLSHLSLVSAFVTLCWIVVISTAISYVGGVDGLGEGTCAIAILILTLIGVRNGDVLTITIGSLALGGLLGLLPYNFHPAVIYSEHLTYGFIIAILAIISKGKVTTSILILTVPILDFIYVCIYRTNKYFSEQKQFNLKLYLHYLGGRGGLIHFQHRMMKIGFIGNNPIKISIVGYILYGLFGFIALAVSGLYLTFVILGIISIVVIVYYFINLKIRNGRQ